MKARLFLSVVALLTASATLTDEALAQSNNNDSTPLNSRIRRARPLPNEPRSIWEPRQLSEAQRARSNDMMAEMGDCMWSRSNEKGLDLLQRTDFGFVAFEQIGLSGSAITDNYPVETCLDRVGRRGNTGYMLRFTAASMRSWYLQAAYFDRYAQGPSWIRPGLEVPERTNPLSAERPEVIVVLDFADCLVAQDPHGADYLFRTAPGSAEEMSAIRSLVPSMSPCLPEGQELEIDPVALRQWIGEGLWHASNSTFPQSPSLGSAN